MRSLHLQTEITKRIRQAIVAQYKGRPSDLARDSGATRRTAEGWLASMHTPHGHHLLNIAARNAAFDVAVFGKLIQEIKENFMDWTDCDAVERVPGRMSGEPVLKGSRVRPSDLLVNADRGAEWLAEAHFLPVEQIRDVLAFYKRHMRQLAPAV